MTSTTTYKTAGTLAHYIEDTAKAVEARLDELVPCSGEQHALLFEAARYALLGGGKRLRPILAIATAEALGKERDEVLTVACALELLHTYSLIHDDLPCMDNDDFRRGKPSLHRAYPEAVAVLAGDYLLTRAFEVIAADGKISDTQKVKLVQLLARGAGGHGMIAGQLIDIQSEGKTVSYELLQTMHRKKTGALIITSVLFGALIGNANKQQLSALHSFASDMGLAFQIVDDILDVVVKSRKGGDEASSDLKNKKSTYVSTLGLEEAKLKASQLKESAAAHLVGFENQGARLRDLMSVWIKDV